MMQYSSAYVRTCPNRDYCRRLEKRVQRLAPEKGNVRKVMLVITQEKQYRDMKLIVGSKSETEKKDWG